MDLLSAGFVLFFGTNSCLYTPPKPVESRTDISEKDSYYSTDNTLVFTYEGSSNPTGCLTTWFATREDLDKFIGEYPVKPSYVFMSVGTREIIKVTQIERPEYNGKISE